MISSINAIRIYFVEGLLYLLSLFLPGFYNFPFFFQVLFSQNLEPVKCILLVNEGDQVIWTFEIKDGVGLKTKTMPFSARVLIDNSERKYKRNECFINSKCKPHRDFVLITKTLPLIFLLKMIHIYHHRQSKTWIEQLDVFVS